MIIDKSKPEFKDVPDSLEGEVLLERVVDGNGKPVGFITATVETVEKMKAKPNGERKSLGWEKYNSILDES
jgi:hypothetical protein